MQCLAYIQPSVKISHYCNGDYSLVTTVISIVIKWEAHDTCQRWSCLRCWEGLEQRGQGRQRVTRWRRPGLRGRESEQTLGDRGGGGAWSATVHGFAENWTAQHFCETSGRAGSAWESLAECPLCGTASHPRSLLVGAAAGWTRARRPWAWNRRESEGRTRPPWSGAWASGEERRGAAGAEAGGVAGSVCWAAARCPRSHAETAAFGRAAASGAEEGLRSMGLGWGVGAAEQGRNSNRPGGRLTPRCRRLLVMLSRVRRGRLCATPQTAAHRAPRSPGFSRQEHWSGLPLPLRSSSVEFLKRQAVRKSCYTHVRQWRQLQG